MRLPWPPAALSPNARPHWAAKARAAKTYRATCFWVTKEAGLLRPAGGAILLLTFCPPDKRRRDDDNLIAMFKAGRDGIAQALGVDDSVFEVRHQIGPVVRGGAVLVAILPPGDAPE